MSQEGKNKYLRQLRTKRRKFAYNSFGGKCNKCGSEEWLQFDHIDPKTKLYSIGEIWGTKEEIFIEELKKCQLLCQKCHIEKNKKEIKDGVYRTTPPAKHGGMRMYWKYKCRCDLCRKFKHQQYLKYG